MDPGTNTKIEALALSAQLLFSLFSHVSGLSAVKLLLTILTSLNLKHSRPINDISLFVKPSQPDLC